MDNDVGKLKCTRTRIMCVTAVLTLAAGGVSIGCRFKMVSKANLALQLLLDKIVGTLTS